MTAHLHFKPNASFLKKLLYMTLVAFTVYIILGIIGFFLWFAFPLEVKNGLTYPVGSNLIYYYIHPTLLTIVGILFFDIKP